MPGVVQLCFLSAMLGGVVGLSALRRDRSLTRWIFSGGMLALACERLLNGLSWWNSGTPEGVFWQRAGLVAAAAEPGLWIAFSVVYSRGNPRESLARWRWLLVLSVALLLFASLGLGSSVKMIDSTPEFGGVPTYHMAPAGRALFVILLLGSALVLMNAERTFRASVGLMRWRIKFMMLALVVLFGVRVYTDSQVLLYSTIQPRIESLGALAMLVACGLMGWSLVRAGFFEAKVYPSGAVLQGSITLGVIGLYLLLTGGLAKVLTVFGQHAGLPLKSLLILIALVLLSILFLSDRVRQQAHRFVSQHFHRPLHNYRQLWMAFAERTGSLLQEADLCREAAKLVAEGFEVLSVTVWLVEDGSRLVVGASTSLVEKNAWSPAGGGREMSELLQDMRQDSYPVDLDRSRASWVEALKALNPEFFERRGGRVCIPLVAQDEVLGVISLGDRINGAPFSIEDLDLLKCIGEQVAASLLNLQLSQRLQRAKQMEAFQAMSAFFVHDLKNTAHSLSLLLQNLPSHFQDPAFRADAQRAVSNSVDHLNQLVGRLGSLRQKLEIHATKVDLNQLIRDTLEHMHLREREDVEALYRPLPHVLGDPEHLEKVVTNLVINAREAAPSGGSVQIATERRNGWAVFSVTDPGRGMSSEFISKNLFRPFQTTKKNGLGIGTFQTKMIVEAHQGRIEVESKVGRGTTFRVLLPLKR